MTKMAEPFVPKPDMDRIPFNPNVRHNMDEIPNDLIYRALDILPPRLPPQSNYVSI
jgi:hypothetical protein